MDKKDYGKCIIFHSLFGAGERGHTLHASTGIKTHHFTHFLGIFGCFCVIFYALPDRL